MHNQNKTLADLVAAIAAQRGVTLPPVCGSRS
jgi:hypothetical protein